MSGRRRVIGETDENQVKTDGGQQSYGNQQMVQRESPAPKSTGIMGSVTATGAPFRLSLGSIEAPLLNGNLLSSCLLDSRLRENDES